MTRVVAYVDGFNLYHGLKAGYGRRYHWLDLQALVRDLLRPGQELLEVQYFTARVRDNLDAESRQALFQDKPRECRNCGARWMAYEEKETDVNIAIAMLTDAVRDVYDIALLVSADSDLRPVVAAVKHLGTGKRIVAAFPPRRRSKSLAQAVDGYVSVSHTRVRNAQLPPEIVTRGGVRISRPAYWG
jgi:uncharacterized LabA/DUF88 family protein